VLGTVLEDEEYLRPSDSLLLRRSGGMMRGGAGSSGSTDHRQGWSSGGESEQGRLDLLRGGASEPDVDAAAGSSSSLPVERILGGFAQALVPIAANIGRALSVIADGARGQRRSDWDRRFRLEVKLPRVAGDSNRSIILEIDELEKTLIRDGVKKWEDFYQYVEAQLQGPAQSWHEEVVSSGRGKALYDRRYHSPHPSDRDWWELYVSVRRGLLPRLGVQYEDPAIAVKNLWEKTKFPNNLKYAEDLDVALGKVVQSRRLMYRYGEFLENNTESLTHEP